MAAIEHRGFENAMVMASNNIQLAGCGQPLKIHKYAISGRPFLSSWR